MIEWADFEKVDMRVGRVVRVDDCPEIGTKRSSAQVTHYPRQALEGRQVVAVVNRVA